MKNQKLNLKNALILSVVLHLIFFIIKYPNALRFGENDFQKKAIESKTLKFVLLPSAKNKNNENIKNKQIVNNELTGRNERPLDSRFLGEKDQVFDRQKIAKKIDLFKDASKGVETGANTIKDQEKTASEEKSKSTSLDKISLNQLGLGNSPIINSQSFKKIFSNENRKAESSQGDEKIGSKTGNSEELGVAANNDYVEDVPLGDATNLNTTEFKYYGFYFRIRQKLEQYWGRSIKEKAANLYKNGRRVASDNDMITSLIITLNNQGKIVDVEIKGSSGVKELDEAAVESFNKAGPFPNPPIGMIQEGKIKIEWGFVVKS